MGKVAEAIPEKVKASRSNTPFFLKEGADSLHAKNETDSPFFSSQNSVPVVQTKPASGNEENNMIQRQEHPDPPNALTPNPPVPGSFRAKKCAEHPESHNLGCFVSELKLDIDENLWNNAHQFYQVALLHPGDNELMWNTFLRYGLGVNLLQTSFGFLGAKDTLGKVLSYGTGVGLKTYDLFKNGKLKLDIPIPLGKDLNLDLKLDLDTDPNNMTNVKSISTGVGVSGHF